MADTFTILTVCTGNVHRSALASDLLATWARWYLPAELRERVVVGSAGTRAPVGEPMGGMTRRVATALGADDRAHRARALSDPLIADADLVLAASRAHRDDIVRRVPRAMRRTFTIREAGRIAAMMPSRPPATVNDLVAVVTRMAELRVDSSPAQPADDDIVDPQGKGTAGMDDMVRDEVPALAQLAIALLGMPAGDAAEYKRVAGVPESLRGFSLG